MGEKVAYVHLEIKRIQTYLFSVPKLKAIIGANVILGETTMGTKEDLEKPGADNFVQLAIKNKFAGADQRACPSFNEIDQNIKDYFTSYKASLEDDSPLEFAEKGIVSRHGGHFSAFFKDVASAENFIKDVNKMVFDKLPGAKLKVEKIKLKPTPEEIITGWESMADKLKEGESSTKSPDPSEPTALPELPVFAMCEGSGNEPAEEYIRKYGDISKSYSEKIAAANRFYENDTKDIVGMLIEKEKIIDPEKIDNSFEYLADSNYIAVIHADGNKMGEKSSVWVQKALPTKGANENLEGEELLKRFINNEFLRETFFFSMRKATRTATKEALNTKDIKYRLFMSGGDDLFIVCQPKDAFEFIKTYAKKIKDNKLISKNGDKLEECETMSIGAGVVIAHHKLPIVKLHATAEDLASNAKKRNRHLKQDENVVDWIVASESFIGEVDEYRKNNVVIENEKVDETCYLTMKPYDILGDKLSLESLMESAGALKSKDGKRAARNKYKGMIDDLKQGSVIAKILYDEMPAKDTFEEVKKLIIDSTVDKEYWPYVNFDDNTKSFTCIPDIIELAEINLLGKSEKKKEDENND